MPKFTYSARTRAGEKISGEIDANDKQLALRKLEALGHIPISVSEGGSAKSKQPGSKKKSKKRFSSFEFGKSRRAKIKTRDLLLLTGELSDLVASGMTLGSALNTLARRDTDDDQNAIVTQLRDDIIQGSSLSDALSQWPETFSQLYISMVKAGEASGALAEALTQLKYHYERVQEAKERVSMALVYPSIIMVLGLVTIAFTMIFVVPKFTSIFAELGSTLPGPTRFLIALSDLMINYGWVLLIGIFVVMILIKNSLKTRHGLRIWHRIQLRLPLVSSIVKANAFAHFARTLGALLTNGVPVLDALTIVENTVGNLIISEEISAARERVTDGSTISGPLSNGNIFPPLLTDMLTVGEESGDMSGALHHIGKRYDSELDRTIKIFTTMLEPLLIVVMAVLVGFVAISMLLAVFDMTSGLNV